MKLIPQFLLFCLVDAASNSRCSLRYPRWENLDLLEEENFSYTTKLLSSGKKILLADSVVNVYDAMRVCQAVCGRLFLPASSDENQEAAEFITGNGGDYVWLRASDKYEEGVWKDMATLENVTYTNWGPNEPNDYAGEDYVHMTSDGLWNDWNQSAGVSTASYSVFNKILCELPAAIEVFPAELLPPDIVD